MLLLGPVLHTFGSCFTGEIPAAHIQPLRSLLLMHATFYRCLRNGNPAGSSRVNVEKLLGTR